MSTFLNNLAGHFKMKLFCLAMYRVIVNKIGGGSSSQFVGSSDSIQASSTL